MTFPRAVHLVKSITHKEGLSCPSTKRSAKVVLKHRTGCRFRSDAHSSWVNRDFNPLNLIELMEYLWDITDITMGYNSWEYLWDIIKNDDFPLEFMGYNS